MKKRMLTILVLALAIIATAKTFSFKNFGRLPRGARLERVLNSPNYRNGEFQNLTATPRISSDRSQASLLVELFFAKKKDLRPTSPLPSMKSDLKGLPIDNSYVVWFGHSSFYLQVACKRILVDPVLYKASPFSFFNRPFPGTDIYKAEDMPAIDYLIITHDHWDHLDYEAVTKLRSRIGKVVCPLGVGEHFERWGYPSEMVLEMDWYELATLDNQLSIHCFPARHYSGRGLKSNQTLWASFMLSSTKQNIYLSGDSGYDGHFKEVASQYPKIDLAIVENGQYGKDWRYIHLLPEDLLKAIDDLSPTAIITGHNSKYALANHPWYEPQRMLDSAAVGKKYNLLKPMIGEALNLDSTHKKE